MKKRFSPYRSILLIASIAVGFLTATFGILKGYTCWRKNHCQDDRIPVTAIVQTGPQKEALKTTYLAQLLGISVDRPILTSSFDTKKAQKDLLSSPLFKQAEVEIAEPGVLYVDYTVRQPIGFLSDYENMAIDQEGYVFPVKPFFTPKKLPELYLGMKETVEWNRCIKGEEITLAFAILKILSAPIVRDLLNVKRIDVSHAFEKSYGRKEVVILTEDEIYMSQNGREVHFFFPRLLRLSTKGYAQELSNYLKLREKLLQEEKKELVIPEDDRSCVYAKRKIIDFRIPQLAYIGEGE